MFDGQIRVHDRPVGHVAGCLTPVALRSKAGFPAMIHQILDHFVVTPECRAMQRRVVGEVVRVNVRLEVFHQVLNGLHPLAGRIL